MKHEITRDRCPLCGDTEAIEKDLFGMAICHCRACITTWNYKGREIWGYDRNGKKTAAQAAIDARKQRRQDSAKKYGIGDD
jgi:hypothetical protein